MRSSYFQTQVNNANVIKNCYPCGSNCTVISAGACSCSIPSDLTLSTLTVNGKTTINGLIDPTGMEFTPVLTNPGGNPATTIWSNAMDMNKLYYGNTAVSGGGGGGVASVTGGTNISTSGTATDPVINFNPGGVMNMNGAYLTNISSMTISSINALVSTISLNVAIGSVIETQMLVEAAGKVSITEGLGQNATLRLENNGGKYGEIIASETGGFMAIQANSGYNLTMESTGGSVNISAANGDTNVSASVNGGTAGLTLTDTAGNGTVDITTSGGDININAGSKVVVSCADFEVGPSNQATNIQSGTSINLDAGSGSSHITMNSSGIDLKATTVSLTDPTASASVPMSVNPAGSFGQTTLSVQSAAEFYMTTGAIDGVSFGGDQNINYYAGAGQPLEIRQTYYDTKKIRLENNPAEKIIVNADTGSVEIKCSSMVIQDSAGVQQASFGGGGNVGIGGSGVNGSVFLLPATGSYAGINIDSGGNLNMFSGTGFIPASKIVSLDPFYPSTGIVDDFGSTGTAGDVLVKNGSNQLYWGTLSGGWAGLALSNLDMNGFSITSAPSVDINMSAGGKIIMSCSDFEVGINANGTISIGDANGIGNGGLLTYDDATSIWNMAANNGDAIISAGNAGIVKCYGSLNKVEIGDVNSTSNNTRLQIDDGAATQVRVQASQAMAYETPTLTNSFVENLEQIPCNTTIPMVDFTQFSSPINTSTTLCGSSTTFIWVFSGNRNGSSKYTEADRVQVSVNAFVRGCDYICAWWIELENTTTTTTLKGDNFEANTPFLTQHINNPTNGSVDTVLNFTTTFRNTKSVFTDGDTVKVNLYGHASNSVGNADFTISIVLQPLRGWT